MKLGHLHIYILYYLIINCITGSIWTLIWFPIMKIMKRNGRIRTVYVLLKFAMAGYIIPSFLIIYYLWHWIAEYEVNYIWVYTELLYVLLTIFGIPWLAGFIVKGIQFVISCIQLKRYERARYLPVVEEQQLLTKLQKQLRIHRNIKLFHGYSVQSPFSTNFIRPVIYLTAKEYDLKELEIVLTHELYHIKYWDILWKPLFNFISCVYWFNPLVLYVKKQYSRWTEANCDNHCYEDHFEERDYFQVIMNTIIENYDYVNKLASNWCENEKDVIWRMELMQESEEKNWKAKLSLITIVLVIFVSLFTTWTVEYGLEGLYSTAVYQTQDIAYTSNQHYRMIVEKEATINGLPFEKYTKVSWIKQIEVEENGMNYILGQIDSSTIEANECVRAESFTGKTNDLVVLTVHPVSDGGYIGIGIVNSSGDEIMINAEDSLNNSIIIPKDGEYAIFIRDYGSEPVEVYGSYSIIPADAPTP